MNQFETLRRRLRLIRLVERPYVYPSKAELVQRLRDDDLDAVSERTIERDIKAIQHQYGVQIAFDGRKKGYYLHLPDDEDVADFSQFVELLERRERLEFLTTTIGDVRHISRFLQLEQHPQFVGTTHLSVLWEALRTGRCVEFIYQKFDEAGTRRRVEPGLLFEYRNRWYLDGYDLTADRTKTFGLDRIQQLTPTDQPIQLSHAGKSRTDRRHVIGVTAPASAQPKRMVLRVDKTEAHYFKTLPLHTSQRLIWETAQFSDFELFVILNHELEREILAFGEWVEILEPVELRKKMAKRLTTLLSRYQAKEE
ncbi:helix-turn-helix transcriptional regulator [Spirosoma panaciterrae]|uniref:helix-turn-helix transcriptional regulator n=1 Tax=Spirosoma panaciterrae TaxID=496058 RepID=UPI0003737DC4|nr:WYL domain-containing protein [Spirosoma panaciterrae]